MLLPNRAPEGVYAQGAKQAKTATESINTTPGLTACSRNNRAKFKCFVKRQRILTRYCEVGFL